MMNSVGLENPGVQGFIDKELSYFSDLDLVRIVNLGGGTLDDYIKGAELLRGQDVDVIELNISCPNVKAGGMAFGIKNEVAREVIREVRKVVDKPLVIKLSPNAEDIVGMARVCEEEGAAGVRLAGDFLLEIAKTIRGYGGASIFASQDLADFFDLDGGRFGKGIINNSKTKIILNLEDDEAQRVQEALHLSDAETMEITHFERGHGLISTNNNNIMVEFKASPLEKDLITTDRRELREIVERKRREQSTSAQQQI